MVKYFREAIAVYYVYRHLQSQPKEQLPCQVFRQLTLLDGTESGHDKALSDIVTWCRDNYLDLNVTKTKEMINDFSKKASKHNSNSKGEKVQTVNTYKY